MKVSLDGLPWAAMAPAHEAHRQSLLAAQSASASDDQAFVDAISEWPDA